MKGIVGFHLGGFLGLISCSWAWIGARVVKCLDADTTEEFQRQHKCLSADSAEEETRGVRLPQDQASEGALWPSSSKSPGFPGRCPWPLRAVPGLAVGTATSVSLRNTGAP